MPQDSELFLQNLSPQRRAKIEQRAKELLGEHLTLQEIRKAQKLTQEHLAQILGVGQDSISRLENRTDLHLSTLNNYIEALGGKLKLIAEFPDLPPITIHSLTDLTDDLQETGVV
jgi:transcriptional regulator with XRE-family HTH domain